MSAGPYDVIVSLCKLVNQIYHQWPMVDVALRAGINSGTEDPAQSKIQIVNDLIKVAPLIAGCFAPFCGSSHHLKDQIMARAAYNGLRLRDLTVKDLEADDQYLLRIYVSLRRILLHQMTPVWPFHLLEDILSVPVQELIRYSPDLFHLRSRHHYGEPHAVAKSDDGDAPGAHHLYEMVNAVRGREPEIMGLLYPDHDAVLTDDQKIFVRNHGLQALNRDGIPHRFDLDVTSDLILGRSWTLPELDGYIRWMSFKHDWGRFPSADAIDLILRHSTGGAVPAHAIEELSELEAADEPAA